MDGEKASSNNFIIVWEYLYKLNWIDIMLVKSLSVIFIRKDMQYLKLHMNKGKLKFPMILRYKWLPNRGLSPGCKKLLLKLQDYSTDNNRLLMIRIKKEVKLHLQLKKMIKKVVKRDKLNKSDNLQPNSFKWNAPLTSKSPFSVTVYPF